MQDDFRTGIEALAKIKALTTYQKIIDKLKDQTPVWDFGDVCDLYLITFDPKSIKDDYFSKALLKLFNRNVFLTIEILTEAFKTLKRLTKSNELNELEGIPCHEFLIRMLGEKQFEGKGSKHGHYADKVEEITDQKISLARFPSEATKSYDEEDAALENFLQESRERFKKELDIRDISKLPESLLLKPNFVIPLMEAIKENREPLSKELCKQSSSLAGDSPLSEVEKLRIFSKTSEVYKLGSGSSFETAPAFSIRKK